MSGKVVWLDPPRPTDARCPLCGNAKGNHTLLQALHWDVDRGHLDFAICGSCGSGFYPQAATQVVGYPASEVFADPNFVLLLYHYLELAATVEMFVGRLERLPFEQFASVLEIGCGMGLAIDYCRVAWGVEAIGVEPSAYGKGGAHLLDLPILNSRLDEAELGGRTFDLVAAIEVVEHVSDPVALVTNMQERLSPAGVLLIAVPSVEVITPDADPAQLYGALSAGAHWFVPSRRAIERLLYDCGLAHQQVHTGGGGHLAAASRAPLAAFRTPDSVARARRYLAARIDHGFVDSRVELAYLIHLNDPTEAVQDRIDTLLDELFEISLDQPLAIADRVAAARDLLAFGRAVPYGLPFVLRERAATRPDLAALAAVICAYGLQIDYQNLARYEHLFSQMLGLARRAATMRRLTPAGQEMLQRAAEAGARVPELRAASAPPGIRTLPRRAARAIGRRVMR